MFANRKIISSRNARLAIILGRNASKEAITAEVRRGVEGPGYFWREEGLCPGGGAEP